MKLLDVEGQGMALLKVEELIRIKLRALELLMNARDNKKDYAKAVKVSKQLGVLVARRERIFNGTETVADLQSVLDL